MLIASAIAPLMDADLILFLPTGMTIECYRRRGTRADLHSPYVIENEIATKIAARLKRHSTIA
jgi:hypothetical protein